MSFANWNIISKMIICPRNQFSSSQCILLLYRVAQNKIPHQTIRIFKISPLVAEILHIVWWGIFYSEPPCISVVSVSVCADVISMQKLGAQSDAEKRLQMLSAMKETDVASREQLSRLEEDIRQQEMILAGYEKDNERLHSDMKRLQATNKANEECMFHENHKLKTEVANLQSVFPPCHWCIDSYHNSRPFGHVIEF